jgi:GYF domain 2
MDSPGFPPGAHLKGGRNSAPVHAEMAREFYAPLIPHVLAMHRMGFSLRRIAAELVQHGVKSRHGFPRWSAAQVRRVLVRGMGGLTESPPAPRHCELAGEHQQPPSAPPQIYLLVDEQKQGPFTESHVKAMLDAGTVSVTTPSRYAGWGGWTMLQYLFEPSGA